MRFAASILTCCLLLAACGRESDQGGPAGSAAEAPTATADAAAIPAVLTRLDLTPCLQEQSAELDQAPSGCPTFVLLSLDFIVQECSRVGGTLQPMEESTAWSLDVDADSKAEILVDLTQNFICYGVPSVLSCGSSGCPYFLYAQRGDAWMELGSVKADDAPGIEVLAGTAGTPGILRGGCTGARPCSELTYYVWNGSAYKSSWINFRGHEVDVAHGGLWTLTRDAPVLTAPSKDGLVIDEYPAGTSVIVIGAARGASYQFVSPCNACRRGFVEAAALKK